MSRDEMHIDSLETRVEELEQDLQGARSGLREAEQQADKLESERDKLQEKLDEAKREAEFQEGRADDAEKKAGEVQSELSRWTDAFIENDKMQCAIHDFMREQGYITDPARDVPFHSTPTVWQTEIDSLVQSVTP